MKGVFIICMLTIVALTLPVAAEEINAQIVESSELEITQSGTITISGATEQMWINISIPQNFEGQKVKSIDANLPFEFSTDRYGNKFMTFSIKNPDKEIFYQITSVVEIKKYNCGMLSENVWLEPTPLVQSTDPVIKEMAEQITIGEKGEFSDISKLAAWINENIRYKEEFYDVNLTSRQTLQKKEGVCDEMSNLLAAFARSIGYPSAVLVGYAYGRLGNSSDFQPHSFVQIGGSGCWDPTWAQGGFVDALHIVFARLPDSRWNDITVYIIGNENTSIEISPMNVSIRLKKYSQNPVVSMKSEALEPIVSKGYAVIKTDITTNGCVMTKLKSVSCGSQDSEFMAGINTEDVIGFCGNATFFSIFKVPDNLEKNAIYTCPIRTYAHAGTNTTTNIKLNANAAYEDATLKADKYTAMPGEKITFVAQDQYIFTDYGAWAKDNLTIIAPAHDFRVWSYAKGGLVEAQVYIVKFKPIEVEIISNDSVQLGETINISMRITNKLQNPQAVSVRFGNRTETKTITTTDTFHFTFTPKDREDRLLKFIISTGQYNTTEIKVIEVREEKQFFAEIMDIISGFFSAIVDYITGLFK